jgi:hypothetical protein
LTRKHITNILGIKIRNTPMVGQHDFSGRSHAVS